MGLVKFQDSNAIKGFNAPQFKATVDTYNGYAFKIVADEAVSFATDAEAKALDIYMMNGIIDKPEILNTNDFKTVDGEALRAFRLKDFVGRQINLSQDLVYYRVTGTNQVETATVVGTIGVAGAGNAKVIVTAAGMSNSPKTISVAVANDDTASQVATKIRSALTADADVGHATTGFFTVSGATDKVILTKKTKSVNDATINIAIDNDTCTGLTAAPTSANTTAGVLPITTNAGMYADLTVGDYLVPRVDADTDFKMKWKKVSSISGYTNYLKVAKKNTFG